MSSRRRIAIAGVATAALAVCAVAGAAVVTRQGHSADAASASGVDGGSRSPSAAASASASPSSAAAGGQAQTGTDVAGSSASAPKVPKLRHLTPPDIVINLHRPATAGQLARLRRTSGVRHVAALSRGNLAIGGHRIETAGVPLATIRGFTPKLTAVSNPLWRSIAQGELTVAYTSSRPLKHRLGATLVAIGGHNARTPLRIGAFATIALPGVDALLSPQQAAALQLPRDREVLVEAPKPSLDQLRSDVTRVFGGSARVHVTRAVPVDQSIASPYAISAIPASYLDLYRRAAVTCPGLPWTVLAGIGTVETGNGSNVHRSTAGAEGPMQFEPSTWAKYGIDADGDGVANINDPVDAVFSAAGYLCAAGAGRGQAGIDQAVFSYNHAWWYVREVIDLANRYA